MLNEAEKEEAKAIIETNDFRYIEQVTANEKIKHFLRHYQINRGNIATDDPQYKKVKKQYDKLIKEDKFINLTLTYDFETETPKPKKKAKLSRV